MKRLLDPESSKLVFVSGAIVALLMACGHVGVGLEGDKLESNEDASTGGEAPSDGVGETEVDNVTDDEPGTEDGEETAETEPVHETESEPEPARDAGIVLERDASMSEERDGDGGQSTSDGGRDKTVLDAGERPVEGRDASRPGDVEEAGVRQDAGKVEPEPEPEPEPISVCLPECGCEGDTVCDLSCDAENCWPTCGVGSACNVDVGASTNVSIECAEGADCNAEGAFAQSVEYVCEGGGDCAASCGEASSCSMTCVGGGKCTLYCSGAESCAVQCSEESTCFVVRQNDVTDTGISCEADNRLECGDSVVGCAAGCP